MEQDGSNSFRVFPGSPLQDITAQWSDDLYRLGGASGAELTNSPPNTENGTGFVIDESHSCRRPQSGTTASQALCLGCQFQGFEPRTHSGFTASRRSCGSSPTTPLSSTMRC